MAAERAGAMPFEPFFMSFCRFLSCFFRLSTRDLGSRAPLRMRSDSLLCAAMPTSTSWAFPMEGMIRLQKIVEIRPVFDGFSWVLARFLIVFWLVFGDLRLISESFQAFHSPNQLETWLGRIGCSRSGWPEL